MSFKKFFDKNGYQVIRGMLTPSEVAFYKAEIQALSGVYDSDLGSKVFECPDGVSKNRVFWPLITNSILLARIRELLGSEARYVRHSDLHAHRAGYGWHRDSACRQFGVGADWDESEAPYNVVRVAIYLQTYAESGSALGVIPGSHRYEAPLPRRTGGVWRRLVRALRKLRLEDRTFDPQLHMMMRTSPRQWLSWMRPPARPVWIKTEPGDCIIFNQRLYHSATPIRGPKYAVYLAYASENVHARNHLAYYLNFRKDLAYGTIDPKLAEILRQNNLYMEPPEEDYPLPDGFTPGGKTNYQPTTGPLVIVRE